MGGTRLFSVGAQTRASGAFKDNESIFAYFRARFNYYLNRPAELEKMKRHGDRAVPLLLVSRTPRLFETEMPMRSRYFLAMTCLLLTVNTAPAQRKEAVIIFKDGFFLSGKVVQKSD